MNFRLTKRTMLAIEAVLDVAYYAEFQPVQAKEITQRQKIPMRYLEHVMQILVHKNILRGVRGPKGGYVLAKERRKISLADIIIILEQSMPSDDEDDGTVHSELGQMVISPVWNDLSSKIVDMLSEITLEDLCRRGEHLGVGGKNIETSDYII